MGFNDHADKFSSEVMHPLVPWEALEAREIKQ